MLFGMLASEGAPRAPVLCRFVLLVRCLSWALVRCLCARACSTLAAISDGLTRCCTTTAALHLPMRRSLYATGAVVYKPEDACSPLTWRCWHRLRSTSLAVHLANFVCRSEVWLSCRYLFLAFFVGGLFFDVSNGIADGIRDRAASVRCCIPAPSAQLLLA